MKKLHFSNLSVNQAMRLDDELTNNLDLKIERFMTRKRPLTEDF